MFCLMSSSTFASSSCLFAFYFNDIGYKEPQNTYKKRISPTVFSIQFSICFILPQQAHLFTLISSNVESASGHVRYSMYVHVIHHCVDTNYFLWTFAKTCLVSWFLRRNPKTFAISQRRRRALYIKLKDFPNRNLDYSWKKAKGNRGK